MNYLKGNQLEVYKQIKRFQRIQDSEAVLSLALALRALKQKPTIMDLVKLSRRIRKANY
jgi:hypothetical protein